MGLQDRRPMESTLTPSRRSQPASSPPTSAALPLPLWGALRRNFLAIDVLILGFVAILIGWALLAQAAPGLRLYPYEARYEWAQHSPWSVIAELSVYFLVYLGAQRLGLLYHRKYFVQNRKAPRWLELCNIAYVFLPVAFIPFIFNLLGAYISGVSGVPGIQTHPGHDPAADYDRAATYWDLWLKHVDISVFGVYAPQWMRQFQRPWLTGVMMVCYLSYYVSPFVAVLPQILKRDWRIVRRVAAIYAGVLLLTYVGYIALPATGPRFEGGPAAWLPQQPGWFGAQWWATVLNNAEVIRWDAFPSGHVAVALVALVVALRYHRRVGLVYLPFVAGLVVATMYLGYHYASDVIAAFVLAGFTFVALEPAIRWWESIWQAPHPNHAGAPASNPIS